MTYRERLARERVIRAALAIAELEHTFGETPLDASTVVEEFRAARKGLYQVVVAKGRQQ